MKLLTTLFFGFVITNLLLSFCLGQSSSTPSVPLSGTGSLAYSSAQALFPLLSYLDATASLSSSETTTTTTRPTSTRPTTVTNTSQPLTTTAQTTTTTITPTTSTGSEPNNSTTYSNESVDNETVTAAELRELFMPMNDNVTNSSSVSTTLASTLQPANHTNVTNVTTVMTVQPNPWLTTTAATLVTTPTTNATNSSNTTNTTRYVDYCTTTDASTQLTAMCTQLFALSAVSGFGTNQVKYSWGVASDGVSRGSNVINSQMMTTPGTLTAKGCQTTLELSADGKSRYVTQIRFNCSCNDNLVTANDDGSAVGVTIDTRSAAINKNSNLLTASWSSGFQSSPRGGTCETRTGRCPSMAALSLIYQTQLLRNSDTKFTEFGCAFLTQFPYLTPLQNYFQDCTPRTLKCSANSTIDGRWEFAYFNFSCPLCRGGIQTYAMTMVSPASSNSTTNANLTHCASNYYAGTGRVCESFGECSGNGCCRTEENVATNLFLSGTSACACFDNDKDGHYLNAACDRCSSRYTICTDSSDCGGGAAGVGYYMCIVDQQQLLKLLADLSTSPMAMTMPLLVGMGVFIIIGLIRSSWESDQEFEMTGIRRTGCNSISGKLASLGGIDEATRYRLHLAIDKKIIPSRHPKSKGMVQQELRKRAATVK